MKKEISPFLVISREKSELASGDLIDGENLAIVMASNSNEALDIFIRYNPAWKLEEIKTTYLTCIDQ